MAKTKKKQVVNRKAAASKKSASKKTVAKKTTGDKKLPKISLNLVREAYFPTQIYFTDLPDSSRINAGLRKTIRAERQADPQGMVRSNVESLGAWHSLDNLNQKKEFAELCEYIVAAAGQVFTDMSYRPNSYPVISNLWANISPKYAFNRVHTHPGTAWSGVYYVQGPADSGKIYFQDPRPQAQVYNISYDDFKNRKKETWTEVFYEPLEGRLILFPAWLQHEVQPNLCRLEGEAGERISISFNINQATQNPSKAASKK